MPGKPQPRPTLRRFVPLGLLIAGGVLFLALGGGRYLSFATLADNREWLLATVARGGAAAALAYISVYAGLVALSVPGGALLTMTGGFLFGPWLGGVYAVIGATIGATLVFLAARAGLAGLVARAGPLVRRLDDGFRRNALNYLLVLRLVPLFPFWVVNLAAAALGVRLPVYLLGTFVGIIPMTFILASLGSGLGAVIAEGRRPDFAILSRPGVLLPVLGFAALALLPVFYKHRRDRAAPKPALPGTGGPADGRSG